MAVATRSELGRWGEDVAVAHLRRSGMAVLDRNWRCRDGEIDVVAREPDGTVVFVEVKTRSGTGYGDPAEAVGAVKARRLHRLAVRWLVTHRDAVPAPIRFDVVTVLRRQGRPVRLEHRREAF